MPAKIVLAHDDAEFVESTSNALRAAGHDVAAFADSMSALAGLEAAQRVAVLITRARFPEGTPNGLALGLMARLKRPGVKVLFVGQPELQKLTEGVGEFLPIPTSASDVVERVYSMLANSGD